MIKAIARTSGKQCTGFKGCKQNIYIGFFFYRLRKKKYLCECCGDKIEVESEDNKFWRLLINRVK